MFQTILENVNRYYTNKVLAFGAQAKGVDWNSTESQRLRFEQLLKVCDTNPPFSIIDYGCGYGALLDYILEQGYTADYQGFDISEEMISNAMSLHHDSNASFVKSASQLTRADYVVASGIFNVRLETTEDEWLAYILHTLNEFAQLSQRGFAFNALTRYSDPERMRPDLFYCDPSALFDYCKRRYSKFVALLHDYPLYEFTILVRKEAPHG